MPKRPTEVSGRFGKLEVIHCNLPPRNRILVRCDCGKKFATRSYDLLSGRTASCGGSECSTRAHHLHGQRFGYLTVHSLSRAKNNRGELMWICKCDCGKTRRVKTNNLLKGFVKSCGCQKDIIGSRKRTKPIDHVAVNTIWHRYRNGAKYRDLEFNLSKDEVRDYIFKRCHYCNSELSNLFIEKCLSGDRHLLYNGIDRINSNVGYNKDNCVTCCKMCNQAKNDTAVNEFLAWARTLVDYQNLKAA